jgi:hypothetical protein
VEQADFDLPSLLLCCSSVAALPRSNSKPRPPETFDAVVADVSAETGQNPADATSDQVIAAVQGGMRR